MFAVVSKYTGLARSSSEEWSGDPTKITSFTKATAEAFCDPDWQRVELYSVTVSKLERFQTQMAKTPRKAVAKVNTQAEQLTAALNFISVGMSEHEFWHSHVRLSSNYAVAFNGQVAAGHPIVEELEMNPHGDKLKSALAKCGKSLVISETPGGKLSIKGDKLRALVDCLPTDDIPAVQPDQPDARAMVSETLKEALRITSTLASEAADEVAKASVLLEANTCTGTNLAALIQFWHGIDLPPQIVLPKVFAAAVAKQPKLLTGIGFGWNNDFSKVTSVTFWFEGGCWLKTVCYADDWPDVSRILNVQTAPEDVPAGLFEGIAAVADFADKGSLPMAVFGEGKVLSHYNEEVGAQYEIKGLKPGKAFAARLVGQIAPFVKTLDYQTHEDRMFFFGGDDANPIRGVAMGLRDNRVPVNVPPAVQLSNENFNHDYEGEDSEIDDDIAF